MGVLTPSETDDVQLQHYPEGNTMVSNGLCRMLSSRASSQTSEGHLQPSAGDVKVNMFSHTPPTDLRRGRTRKLDREQLAFDQQQSERFHEAQAPIKYHQMLECQLKSLECEIQGIKECMQELFAIT